MARPTGRDIRSEAIEAATQAIQRCGTTGLSFGSIARELGIKAPSIHHHFRRKADLLAATVAHYRAQFRTRVEALEGATTRERLEAYADLFLEPAEHALLCLCGAAAADWKDIDAATRAEVEAFFHQEIAWVAAQVAKAIDADEFASGVDATAFATAYLAALEGALLLARMSDGHQAVPRAASCLLDLATNRAAARARPAPCPRGVRKALE